MAEKFNEFGSVYIDGVPVKLGDKFIPLQEVKLPKNFEIGNPTEVLSMEYDFSLEESVIAWSEEREKHLKQVKIQKEKKVLIEKLKQQQLLLQEQQKLEALAAAKAEASCVHNENAEREDNNSNPVDNIIQKDETNDNGKNENLPALSQVSANESSDDSPRQDNDIFPQKIAVNVQQTQFTNTNLPNMQQPFVSNINRNQPMFYSVGQDILTPLPASKTQVQPNVMSTSGASSFNPADFENEQDPFDNMELKTLDDMKELNQVLQNVQNVTEVQSSKASTIQQVAKDVTPDQSGGVNSNMAQGGVSFQSDQQSFSQHGVSGQYHTQLQQQGYPPPSSHIGYSGIVSSSPGITPSMTARGVYSNSSQPDTVTVSSVSTYPSNVNMNTTSGAVSYNKAGVSDINRMDVGPQLQPTLFQSWNSSQPQNLQSGFPHQSNNIGFNNPQQPSQSQNNTDPVNSLMYTGSMNNSSISSSNVNNSNTVHYSTSMTGVSQNNIATVSYGANAAIVSEQNMWGSPSLTSTSTSGNYHVNQCTVQQPPQNQYEVWREFLQKSNNDTRMIKDLPSYPYPANNFVPSVGVVNNRSNGYVRGFDNSNIIETGNGGTRSQGHSRSNTPPPGMGLGKLRSARSTPDLLALANNSVDNGELHSAGNKLFQSKSPPIPRKQRVFEANNVENTTNKANGFGSIISTQIAPAVDPYKSMSGEEKRFVDKLTNMGFRRITVARTVQRLGMNEKQVLDFLCGITTLKDKGLSESDSEKILLLPVKDRKKAQDYLLLCGRFKEFGFEESKVQEGLLKCNLDEEKTLDWLTSH